MRTSKRAMRAALHEILENQIQAADPPEVAATLERLQHDGCTEEASWRLLSAVLLLELDTIVRSGREFDRAQYVANLLALPTLPRELTDDPSGAKQSRD